MTDVIVLKRNAQNPEGPVSLPDGSWLFCEMDRGAVSQLDASGSDYRVIGRTPLPNGLAVDRHGSIWIAEAKDPALLRMDMSGRIIRFSTGCVDTPFLLPNDLCFGPDRALYLTDSGIALRELKEIATPDAAYDLPFDGRLFRVDTSDGSCALIDRGFRLTNGIAFGPGGDWLYVAETLSGNIYRYRYDRRVLADTRELYANVMIRPPREHGRIAGPDGMAFDVEGNLYVAVILQGDVTIVGTNGQVSERVKLPGTNPTNVAFDRSGAHRMMVTESSQNQLLMVETRFAGLSLYE